MSAVPLTASFVIGFFQENLKQPSLRTDPNPHYVSLIFIKLSNFVNKQMHLHYLTGLSNILTKGICEPES